MPEREPITIEKIPVLLASLMRDIDELHGSIDSMNVADYYNARLHQIRTGFGGDEYTGAVTRSVNQINGENSDILNFMGIQCSCRPRGIIIEIPSLAEHYSKRIGYLYSQWLDGKRLPEITTEMEADFVKYQKELKSAREIEEILREHILEQEKHLRINATGEIDHLRGQVLSWELRDRSFFTAFLAGVGMMRKDDKTTKDFVTYLMQTLDMKLRYWFFDHPEGREEFIECLEVFQKIIELAIQYRVKGNMPRSYEKNYTRKTLVEYINFLSLGVDPENPNFSITQLPKNIFLDWVKKVYAMLSEINRQETSPIKKEVVNYILEVLNNREKQFTHEDWAGWIIKFQQIIIS